MTFTLVFQTEKTSLQTNNMYYKLKQCGNGCSALFQWLDGYMDMLLY